MFVNPATLDGRAVLFCSTLVFRDQVRCRFLVIVNHRGDGRFEEMRSPGLRLGCIISICFLTVIECIVIVGERLYAITFSQHDVAHVLTNAAHRRIIAIHCCNSKHFFRSSNCALNITGKNMTDDRSEDSTLFLSRRSCHGQHLRRRFQRRSRIAP